MNGKKLNKIVSEAIEKTVNSGVGIKTNFKIVDTVFSLEKISKNDKYQEGNRIGSSILLHMCYDAKDIKYLNPKNFAKIILFGLSENNFYETDGGMYKISKTEFNTIEIIEITLEEIFEEIKTSE